jgi:hypothetical protein
VPALAAVLITGVLGGRPGQRMFLRSWIRWRVSPRWYVFTLLVLPALVLLTYIVLYLSCRSTCCRLPGRPPGQGC